MWWKRSKTEAGSKHPVIVEEAGADWVLCDCCGTKTQKIWGWLSRGESTLASYFVRWGEGHPDAGADFNLLIGPWGGGARPEDRLCVSVHFFMQDDGQPAFRIVDARPDFYGPGRMAAHGASREDVMDSGMAAEIFAMLDEIWLQDSRLAFRP